MSILFDGMIHATGESDAGKTIFSLECGAAPPEIAFFDDDIKGAPVARELNAKRHPFGHYCDLTELGKGMRELEFHGICLHEIGKLEAEPGKYQVIIWDTWSRFAKTCQPYVRKHQKLFREYWAGLAEIKGAQWWLSAFDYEAQIVSRLLSIAPLVILTTHLKPAWRGKTRIPGKFVPDCYRTLVRKARMRVWLRRNPDSPQPIGLLLKRPMKVQVTDNGIKAVNVLPLRMKPCTWAAIRQYWSNPMGDRQPTPEETPNDFELSLLQGTLTADQEHTFRLMLQQGMLGEEEGAALEAENRKGKETAQEEGIPTTGRELLSRTRMTLAQLFPDVPASERFRALNEISEKEVAEKWAAFRPPSA